MKKYVYVLLTIITVLLSSCSVDDEVRYSCDDSVDKWVKDHLSQVRGMTRTDWVELDGDLQRAVYRAFSQEQRIKFWKEKLEKVKMLNWTDEERRHIESAESFIDDHKSYFSGKKLTDEELDNVDLFFYKWQKYGIAHLGWTDRIGKSIFATGLPISDTKGGVIYKTPVPPINCHCSTESDYCEYQISPCKKDNCIYSSYGCGWILVYDCDGRCNGT